MTAALAPYLLLFVVSGACGLAYEVVWTRLLGLSIGHTTVALTAVVSAYMGGLAIGSAAIGRVLKRGLPPLLIYAALEAGVGLLALLFPLQLQLVTSLSAQSGVIFERGSLALAVVRFGLAAMAVLPATVLMGGTLPAMLDAVPGRDDAAVAGQAGALYAVNTAGAVIGAALAGFVLIERIGTYETTWLAAAGNLLVAGGALALGRRRIAPARPTAARTTPKPAPSPFEPPDEVAAPAAILVAYALSGFAAMTLQVVWTRALAFFAGSTTYAFTSMLLVFLGGIMLGSAFASPIVARLRRPVWTFVLLQAGLAVSAGASLRVLQLATPLVDRTWPPELSWTALIAGNFAKAAVTLLVPTLIMGVLFPLTVRLARVADSRSSGALLGRLYALNTAGGIAGAALSGLVLIPLFGIRETLLTACLFSIASALAALWPVPPVAAAGAPAVLRRQSGPEWLISHGLPLVGAVIAAAALTTSGRPLHVPAGSERLVFYEEGTSGTVSVMQEITGTRTIYIDRVPVAGTDAIMLTDQKSLAHVPMLLNPAAKRVLTVGFGSGGASWSFAQHHGLERVDAVEIDPTVFHAAPELEDSNHGVWRDPRFHLILEDARNYLASTNAGYDVISTDCTDLRYKTNANLYTVDYFSLLRDRLNPGGIVTVWMPLGGLGGDTFRMALRTFHRVFPHTTVWYMTNQPTHYLLLVGADRELRPDVAALAAGMSDSAVKQDLAEIRLDDPLKMAASLLLDEREVAQFAGDGPLNTDRHPLLEFQAPRLAYRDALATNLRSTASARDHDAGLRRWQGTAEMLPRLAPYVAATAALVEGHARYQLGTFDYAGSLRLYRAAAAINPADASVPRLIEDVERTRQVWLDEFAARTSAGSTDVREWLSYVTLLRQAGRVKEAIGAAAHATELAPQSMEAWLRLAATQAQAGDNGAAIATLERARQLAPLDAMLLSDLGAAYNEQQRFPEAEAVLRQSLAVRETADAHNNLGVALNGQQRPADAVREFGAALEHNASLADAWFNLGVAHALLGDVAQARTSYQRGLALTPAEPRALFNLAMIEAQAGRLDLSARYLAEAIVHDPQSAQLHNELGRANLGLGRRAEAIAEFERALALDPGSSAARENLALARGPAAPSSATAGTTGVR